MTDAELLGELAKVIRAANQHMAASRIAYLRELADTIREYGEPEYGDPDLVEAIAERLDRLEKAIAAVRAGYTIGQPSSMNLVIAQVNEILGDD